MNKGKKLIFASALAAATMASGAYATDALAYRGDYTKEGPNCTSERHEQMEAAFENNDYEAWKELMNGRGRVTQVVNEDNFAQFAEAHQLAEDGDYDGADKIREKLGLRTRDGQQTGNAYRNGGSGQGQNRNNR